MARPTNIEVELRKNLISDCLVRGISSISDIRQSIAMEGLLLDREDSTANALISKDITEIKLEWQRSRLSNVEEALGAELAKIEKIERIAWEEYERSREEAEKRIKKTYTSTGGGTSTQEIDERAKSIGNPKFLERVCWCIEKRIKLLGLEHVAVQKATLTLRNEVEATQLDDVELVARMDRLLENE